MAINLYIFIYSAGIFPVFKDNKTSKEQLLQWIRLSLYFEKPEIRPGSLFLQSVPRWFENYETGVIAVGFGLHARSLAAIGRYWKLVHMFFIILFIYALPLQTRLDCKRYYR